jgi:hypothetical protein
MGRFWRFLGPGGYRVEVATAGDRTIEEHMLPAPEMGSSFVCIKDENNLSVFVDKQSFDRVVEIPYVAKKDRHQR